ncbi:unnamed protein product, partial [Rotaria magnacalcarata]
CTNSISGNSTITLSIIGSVLLFAAMSSIFLLRFKIISASVNLTISALGSV